MLLKRCSCRSISGRESRRPDAIIKDQAVVSLIDRLDYDFSGYKFGKEDEVAIILRNRQFDRFTQDFLKRFPNSVVVHLGCGLDSRFERVDNGVVEWYDLDLPEVIELRRKLLGGERPRYHLLPCSMLDEEWQDKLKRVFVSTCLIPGGRCLHVFSRKPDQTACSQPVLAIPRRRADLRRLFTIGGLGK